MLYYVVAFLYVLSCFLPPAAPRRPAAAGQGRRHGERVRRRRQPDAFGARAGATVLTKATTVLGGAVHAGSDRAWRHGPAWSRLADARHLGAARQPQRRRQRRRLRRRRRAQQTAPSRRRRRRRRAADTEEVRVSAQSHSRKWRNWQTHQLEGLAVAIPWGFESPLSHHSTHLQPAFRRAEGSLMAGH